MTGKDILLNIVEVRNPDVTRSWWPRTLRPSSSAASRSAAP